MKYSILKGFLLMLPIVGISCTGNYLEINSNPYEVTKEQKLADDYAIMATLKALAGTVISTDVNTAQFTDCLLGGPMGGYYASSNNGFKSTIDNYNATDDWTRVFMASENVIPALYSNLLELESITDDPIVMAIASINKVAVMHRVTDTYGPIPYSKIGEGGKIQVPYDSQEQVYDQMFGELNEAIDALTENRTLRISSKADKIYGGLPEKWCKFANSLKLRLAMRIVYADEDKAKEMAESAVKHEIGVFTSNDDNAKLTSFGSAGNPIYVAVKYNEPTDPPCRTGGDSHVAADIICYMNGYDDPRREKYFVESEWEGVPYVGMRRGIEIPSLNTVGRKYSGVNLTSGSPVYWMNAAEVAFLKAEAAAIFGFDMGGSAEEFYNEGIRLSFEQWNVSEYEAYAANDVLKPETYTDPAAVNSYSNKLSELTVAWDEDATELEKQERIIIQKWIANFHLGNEAWADYRRTGFPKLIPATVAGNKSNGIVKSELGARRMPYPQAEYTNNPENILEAVSSNLTSDDMGARIWWDCNPRIK